MNPSSIAIVSLTFFSQNTLVNTSTSADYVSRPTETISIIGQRGGQGTQKIAGSAHVIDESTLSRFEYDDVQRVLNQVPGVYVRDEDGFGLRPNIGIRGASSERSAKVVLMEDGVLLGPAPYSAPAAYFVPLTTRMIGVEVFKGPAAIRTGPYTVGGAINYLTAQVPDDGYEGLVDVAAGNFGYVKGHARFGVGNDYIGILAEGVRLASSGFKELDGGGNTGFEKNEVMAKFRLNSNPTKNIFHRLEVKLGWADELSNETYLGLTDEDFRANPYRRYRASALANMNWERTQLQAAYRVSITELFEARLTAYRHNFSRAWFKLNLVGDRSDNSARLPSDILSTQTRGLIGDAQLQILRGEIGSSELGSSGQLLVGTNDRSFVSEGFQLDGSLSLQHTTQLEQKIRFGARIHYDEIERTHTERTFEMVVRGNRLGSLVQADVDRYPILTNKESATAFSAYVSDDIQLFEDLVITPGLRVEVISTDSNNFSDPTNIVQGNRNDTIWVPGLGVFYQLTPTLGFLAGVHRGFSPVSPGQSDVIEPEASTNYELGTRFSTKSTSAELIGYFNNYRNLLVTCTGSAGCENEEIDRQFNAGAVYIYGAELLLRQRFALPGLVRLELSGQYTLTLSEFQEGFSSNQPQFEEVETGDRLPYVPEHQTNLMAIVSVPLGSLVSSLSLSYTFVDRMRNKSSAGDIGEDGLTREDFTDIQHIVDMSLQLDLTEESRAYFRIDNLLDNAYIASRRPFGARPGRPRTIQIGYTHRFKPY
ncbi:MAG: TonB-dependent receptor [Myxococcales bacterium]|nr:TonB-dependent receptor [Myxococcales bacterium]